MLVTRQVRDEITKHDDTRMKEKHLSIRTVCTSSLHVTGNKTQCTG